MKKLMSIMLVAVFALSFAAGISQAEVEPSPTVLCYATCDYSVVLLWVCCPEFRGNSGKPHYVCDWGSPCGSIP